MTEWLHFHFSLSCIGEKNGNPLQCSCLENPRDGGPWWAAIYGVTQSWTWLKWLSSSSSIHRFWGFIRILSISFCSLYPVISAFVCVDSFLLLPLGLRHCLFKMGTCCLGFLSFVHSYFFFQLFFFFWLHSMWSLSSLPGDQTHICCFGSMES